jgi:P27 family predicted phage terminase small subunit
MTEPTRPRLATISDATRPLAPKHLSPTTRAWWREVCETFSLEGHHLKLLTLACEALDRALEARAIIDRDGAFYKNRFGEPRAHPAVGVERDARLAFARLLRELALDVATPDESRPPRIGAR